MAAAHGGTAAKGETVYAWARAERPEGVSYEPTPGAGDSEGGDVFAPEARVAAR